MNGGLGWSGLATLGCVGKDRDGLEPIISWVCCRLRMCRRAKCRGRLDIVLPKCPTRRTSNSMFTGFQALERHPQPLLVLRLHPRTPKGFARTTKVGPCARSAEPGKVSMFSTNFVFSFSYVLLFLLHPPQQERRRQRQHCPDSVLIAETSSVRNQSGSQLSPAS